MHCCQRGPSNHSFDASKAQIGKNLLCSETSTMKEKEIHSVSLASAKDSSMECFLALRA